MTGCGLLVTLTTTESKYTVYRWTMSLIRQVIPLKRVYLLTQRHLTTRPRDLPSQPELLNQAMLLSPQGKVSTSTSFSPRDIWIKKTKQYPLHQNVGLHMVPEYPNQDNQPSYLGIWIKDAIKKGTGYNWPALGFWSVILFKKKIQNCLLGNRDDGSNGSGVCHQAWQPEFNPRTHKVGGENRLTFTHAPGHDIHVRTHTIAIEWLKKTWLLTDLFIKGGNGHFQSRNTVLTLFCSAQW